MYLWLGMFLDPSLSRFAAPNAGVYQSRQINPNFLSDSCKTRFLDLGMKKETTFRVGHFTTISGFFLSTTLLSQKSGLDAHFDMLNKSEP